ncbi:hypothetical protein [Oceanobacillus kimchii]|nr:hypothetical protein [Oceanobacillus kimchii]
MTTMEKIIGFDFDKPEERFEDSENFCQLEKIIVNEKLSSHNGEIILMAS